MSSVLHRENSLLMNLRLPMKNPWYYSEQVAWGKKHWLACVSWVSSHWRLRITTHHYGEKILMGSTCFHYKTRSKNSGIMQPLLSPSGKLDREIEWLNASQQLIDLKCRKVIPFSFLYWKYPEVFLPYYALDLPHKVYQQADELRKVFSLWADDESKYEYLAQLRWRMLMDFDSLPSTVLHDAYFPNDLVKLLSENVFVDCGAYDGDTIRNLLRIYGASFKKIIAFEPDPSNFQKLQQFALALPPEIRTKFLIHQQATGIQKGKMRFVATGTEASAIGSGDDYVDCVSLDEILIR